MLVLLGKTASGKSTVLNHLKKNGYNPLVTYTSRPRRKNESANSYHFISKDEFQKKIDDDFFAEWYTFDTVDGLWYYGSAKNDYIKADNKTVVILNPSGYKFLSRNFDIPIKSIYLYSNIATIKERLRKRGDKKEEIERRIACDLMDFKGLEMQVDKIIYNNSGTKINDIVNKIMEFEKE